MSKTIIKAENLSKRFALGGSGSGELRDLITNSIRRILGKSVVNSNASAREYWALRDVSFEIQEGEVIGILGRNGAGKSTLLKVLSRITPPTAGRVELYGRMASLLEVGTGFHPELTGRENIFLNGSIMGMRRQEIRQKLDEIIAFSGVEQFIDTPVKHYSSGMYMRLAFAVAAHLEAEIMVIDEVLAVGDAEFQKKCLGKMKDISNTGRTILFVSHNMGSVRDICQRGIVLSNGNIALQGDIHDCIDFHLASASQGMAKDGTITWDSSNAPGNAGFQLLGLRLHSTEGVAKSTFSYEEPVHLEIDYALTQPTVGMHIHLRLLTDENYVLFASTSEKHEEYNKPAGRYRCTTSFPSHLLNQGNYKVYLHIYSPRRAEFLEGTALIQFHVEKYVNTGGIEGTNLPGFVAPMLTWNVERT